ncbi:uncharacterized protein LOC113359985 [Papaver somniferum]|uniref:uncharacterized protein LOC113359985 n=1 Tax=Papaver somniferum TaxID=3469 RepID=UPI000E6FF2B9|nr:uncharacterized protein LOC113359985 [Papaver somniferum]
MKFAVAEEALRKQWKTSGNYQLIPLGKGFFIIKLANEVDMKYIWNGFWKIGSQIFKLRLWEPNFNPAARKSTTSFVRVNFPDLGIEYWKEKILMSLGDAIGRAIKVDETSLKREVGYYASVLVEVDLPNTVPHHVLVKSKYGSFEQEVQIPKLPSFCSHCKVLGHLVTECRVLRSDPLQQEVEGVEVEDESYNEEAIVDAITPLEKDAEKVIDPASNNTVSITKQVITVNLGGVLVSGIHAASLTVDRRTLWSELEYVSSMDLPWLLIGDFNIVLSIEEKIGGRGPLGWQYKISMKC